MINIFKDMRLESKKPKRSINLEQERRPVVAKNIISESVSDNSLIFLLPIILVSFLFTLPVQAQTPEEAKAQYQSSGCKFHSINANGSRHFECYGTHPGVDVLLMYEDSWDNYDPQCDPVPETTPPDPVPPDPITFAEIDSSLHTDNNGDIWNDTSGQPSGEYIIENLKAGDYTIALYGNGPDASSDSFHFGLNGQFIGSISLNVWESPGPKWSNRIQGTGAEATVTIPNDGTHTINIWPREDGAELFKIRVEIKP